MKITKRQLRRINREEKAKLLKEAPAGQYNQELYEDLKAAIKEVVYEVAIDEGFVEPDGQNITVEAIQAAGAALSDAAREFYREQGMQHESWDRSNKAKFGGNERLWDPTGQAIDVRIARDADLAESSNHTSHRTKQAQQGGGSSSYCDEGKKTFQTWLCF